MLTADEFRRALPDRVKKSVNQELIDRINLVLSEPELYEQYRENLLSHVYVFQGRKSMICANSVIPVFTNTP